MAWTSTNASTRLALGQTSTLKTINGVSLLGDGDITVATSAAGSGNEVQYRANDGTFAAALGSSVDTLGVATLSGLKLTSGTYPTYLDTQYIPTYNFLALTRNGNNVGIRVAELYSSTGSTNKVMAHPTYGVRIASDRALEFSSTSEVTGSADAKITRATGPYIKVQADSGLSVRNLADNAYASATAQAFVGMDYVQGMSRVLVGNSSGGRLLPGSDGINVYNWAQSALGSLSAKQVIAEASGSGASGFQLGSWNMDTNASAQVCYRYSGSRFFQFYYHATLGTMATSANYFYLGNVDGGPSSTLLKNVSGTLRLRDSADGVYANFEAGAVTFNNGTLTASLPVINASQTWNNAAVAFTGSKIDITDTASLAGSKMIDFMSGGVSRVSINKVASAANHTAPFRLTFADTVSLAYSPEYGKLTLRNAANTADASLYLSSIQATSDINVTSYISVSNHSEMGSSSWRGAGRAMTVASGGGYHFSSTTSVGGTADVGFYRNAAGVVEINSGTINTYRDMILRNLTSSSGQINTDYVGRSSTSEPSVRFTSSEGQMYAAGVKVAYWNQNAIYPGTTGSQTLGLLNQAWGAAEFERASFYNNAMVHIRNRNGGDSSHLALAVCDYGLTNSFTVTHAGDIVGKSATLSGGTATTSSPVVNLTQTWNGAGVTFTGIKSNITDTSSAAASLLLDLQVGSVSKFSVDKYGNAIVNNLTVNGTSNITATPGGSSGQLQYNNGGVFAGISGSAVSGSDVTFGGNVLTSGSFQIGNTSVGFTNILDNIIAVSPNGLVVFDGSYVPKPVSASQFSTNVSPSSNTPSLNLSQTWNNVAVPYTLMYGNVTDTASASTSSLIDLQVGAVSQFKVDKSGNQTLSGSLSVGSSGQVKFGSSSLFPMLQRTGLGIEVKRQDNVGYSDIYAENVLANNALQATAYIQMGSSSGARFVQGTDGVSLLNFAGTAPGYLHSSDLRLGGSTGSPNGLLRSTVSGTVEVRNGSDSAAGNISAAAGTFTGAVTVGNTSVSSMVLGNASIAQVGGNVFIASGSGASINLMPSGTTRFSVDSASCTIQPPLTVQNSVTITAGTATTSTPVINATQTWNNGATTFTGHLLNITDTASATASKLLDLQVGSSSKFAVKKDGSLTIAGDQPTLTITQTPSVDPTNNIIYATSNGKDVFKAQVQGYGGAASGFFFGAGATASPAAAQLSFTIANTMAGGVLISSSTGPLLIGTGGARFTAGYYYNEYPGTHTFNGSSGTPIVQIHNNTVSNAGTIVVNNATVTANNPMLNASQTWNNAAIAFTGIQQNITLTAASASSKYLDLQKSGTSQFYVGRGAMRLAAEGYEATNYWNWTVDVNNPILTTTGGNGPVWYDTYGRWYFGRSDLSISSQAVIMEANPSQRRVSLGNKVQLTDASDIATLRCDLGVDVKVYNSTTYSRLRAANTEVYPQATTDKGLMIKMVASHTANPFEIQRSDGTANMYFKPGGGLTVDGASIVPTGGNNYVRPSYGFDVGLDGLNNYANLGLWYSSAAWQVSVQGASGAHMSNRYGDFVITSSGHAARNNASNNGGHLILEFPNQDSGAVAKTFKIRRTNYTTATDIMAIDNASGMTYVGSIGVTPTSASNVPLTLNGVTSQTANLLEAKNVGGSVVLSASVTGAVYSRLDDTAAFQVGSNSGIVNGVGSRFGNNLAMYAVGVIHSVFDNSGFYTRSDRVIGFAANTSPYTNVDTAIGRDSAGVMQVNNGTLNTYRDLKLRSLISSNETVTSSTPILNLTQTWNSGATTFKAITLDVTDTTSASASKFLDFSLGGTSKFSVDKNGNVSLNNLTVNGTHNITMTATPGGTSGQIQYNNGGSLGGMSGSTISGSNMTLTGTFGATSATLTGGTITTSTPAVTATQTWNNVATTFTGLSLDVTDTASASGSKLLDLMVGSSTKFSVDKAGNTVTGNQLTLTPSDTFGTTRITAGNYGTLSLGLNGGYLAVAGTLSLLYTASQFSPVNTGTIDLGQTGTRFKNAYFTGPIATSDNGSASIDAPSGTINGYAMVFTNRLRANSGTNFEVLASSGDLKTVGGIGFHATAATSGFTAKSVLSSTAWQIQADGGLTVKNLAGSADAALTALTGTFSGGTVTASTPVISVSQTWNNVATTFTGITSNVTDTASAAASKLIDLQVGGTSKFSVKKDGSITVPTGSTFSGDVISCGSVVASSYLSTFQLLLSDNVRLRNTPTSVDGDLSVLKMDVTTLGNVRTGVLTLGNPATAAASTDWAKIKATATGAIALRNAADSGYASMTAASTFVGSDVTNYGYTSQVFGRMSLADNTTLRNVFLNGGNATLTGTDNLILSSFGSTSGTSLTSGSCNTAVGNRYANGVGGGLTSGSDNSFFGSGAGYGVSTGNDNVMMGYLSGFNSLSADSNNTYVGAFAGYGGNGSSNVYIGNKAGRAVTGSNNIHIGIGSTSTLTESNKLRIGPVATPIIDGNLSTNAININGAATFSSTGTFSGSVTATTFTAVNGSTGRVMLVSGDATYSGYIEWRNPANSPKWYMGYDSGNDISLAPFASGSVNIGTATYTGSVKLIGSASNATVSVSTGSSLNIDKPLSVTGGTVTASTPIFNGTQTWNSAGVTFNGIFQNITDTSSAAASKLIDLQVGGSSKFNVTKAGTAVFTGTVTAGDSTFGAVYAGTSRLYHLLGSVALESASGSVDLSPAGVSKFNVNSTDVTASAPFTVYAGTATASASIFNGTQTWNNGAVTFTAIKANVTDTASASGSKLLDLQVGSVSKFSVDKAGNTVLNNLTVNGTHNITSLPAGSSGNLQYNNAGVLGGISGSSVSGSDVTLGGNLSAVGLTLSGNVTLASTSRINFGTSAAYPELRRTSNRLEVLRYDGTGYQDLWVNNLEAINDVTASTGDIGVLTTSSTSATVFTGAGGTVTTSTPVLDVSQTWNAGAVAFTLASFNATATAAANGSKLLRVGTAGDIAEIAVQKVASAGNHTAAYRLMFGGALSLAYSPEFGALTLRNAANTAAANFNAYAIGMQEASVNGYITVASWVEMGSSSWRGTNRAITIANTGGVHWTNTSATSGTADIGLNRNAAGVLEVNGGTTNAYRDLKLRSLYAIGGTITTSTPSIDVTQTWNSGATTFTAIKTDIADTASAAASKLIDLQVGSVSKFSVDKAGNTVLNNLTVNGTHNITLSAGGSSGNLQYNNAGAIAGISGSSVSGSDITLGGNVTLPSTGELQFGTTSTYPKLRRVANRLEVYRYDGTGYQDIWANNVVAVTSVGSLGEVFATTNVSASLDVVAGRDIIGVAASELKFGTAAKIKQSSNVIYFQSDSGATFRDYAGTGYSSATGSAFYATDYVQGAQRILIGSSSGGRLLPGTNGIQVYNWAQSALGSVTSNQNVITGGTVTASTPVIDATQTWNSAGTTFTGIKLNVTDTTSAAASKLVDLQVGAVSKFSVDKAGNTVVNNLTVNGTHNITVAAAGSSGNLQYNNAGVTAGVSGSSVSGSNVTVGGTVTATNYLVGSSTGPLIKNNSGAIRLRDYLDSSYANLEAGTGTFNGGATATTFTAVNGSTGRVAAVAGDATYSGYIEWRNPANSPKWYMGYDSGNDLTLAPFASGTFNIGTATYTGSVKLIGSSSNAVISVSSGSALLIDKATTISGVVSATAATLATGTITSSTPAVNVTQTWNSVGTTFAGIFSNITDTASAAASKLLDLQVGSVSKFSVDKAGNTSLQNLTVNGTHNITSLPAGSSGQLQFNSGGTLSGMTGSSVSSNNLTLTGTLGFSTATATGGTVTTSTPVFSGTQTWNNAGGTFTGISLAVTDTASGSGSRLVSMTVGGNSMFAISKAGSVTAPTFSASNTDVSNGSMVIAKGDGSNTGYLEWRNQAGTRKWYMGYDSTNDLTLMPESSGSLKIGSASYTGSIKLVGSASTATIASSTGNTVTIDKSVSVTGSVAGTYATMTTGTITSSTPAIDVTQTWNSAGVTFTGIKSNITDTASAAASKLLDLQVGSVSKFSVDKAGNTSLQNLTVNGTHNITANPAGSSGQLQFNSGGTLGGMTGSSVSSNNLTLTGTLGFSTATSTGGTVTTSTPMFSGTQTWNNVATTFTGILTNVTDTTSATASLLMDLQVGSVSKFSVDKSGTVTSGVFYSGAGTSGVPGIMIGEASTGFYRNAAATIRMTLGAAVSHGWNTGGYETTGYIGFSGSSPGSAIHDVKLSRPSTGLARMSADSGLEVKNFAGSADAALSALRGTFTGGTVTTSTPVLNLTQTWNNVATTFTGILSNVTDTTSAAASLLMDLQVGAASKFKVAKNGDTTVAGTLDVSYATSTANRVTWRDDGGATWTISTGGVANTDGFRIAKMGTADIASFRPSVTTIYTPIAIVPSTGAYGLDVQASGTTAAIRAYSNLGNDINGTGKVPLRLEGVNNGYSSQLRIYPSASQSDYWIFSNSGGQLMEMGTGYVYFNKDLLVGTNIKSVSGGNLVLRGANGHIHFETGSSPTVRGGVSNTGNFVFGATPSTDNATDKLQVTGSVLAAGGTVTASTPVLNLTQTWNNVAVNFTGIKANFTATTHAGNSLLLDLQLAGVSKFSVGWDGNVTTPVDKQFGTSDGQQRLYFANGSHTYYGAGSTGNHVFRRNNGAEYAPIISQSLALGGQSSNPATGCLLGIDDMQGSSYPSIKINKSTWGSPISMSWATESAGISSSGAGALFSHVQTITTTSLANSPVTGGGIDTRCEYDQPYVAGIYVRGRKTRTDAPTHPNLAYGIYAVANSGKASGLGGAAGYFLCETANVAGVQIRAAASQAQPVMLIENSSAAALVQVDQLGKLKMSPQNTTDDAVLITMPASSTGKALEVIMSSTSNFSVSSSGVMISKFDTKGSAVVVGDLASGTIKTIKDTASGKTRIFINDGGTLKQSLPFIADAGSTGWSITVPSTHKTLNPSTTTMTEFINFVATLAQRLKDLGLIDA